MNCGRLILTEQLWTLGSHTRLSDFWLWSLPVIRLRVVRVPLPESISCENTVD